MECTTYIYHLTDYVTINVNIVNIDTYMSQMILIALEARGANPFQSNNNFYLNILINCNLDIVRSPLPFILTLLYYVEILYK